METITFECTCGKSLRVDGRLAGKVAQCPACGATLRIPAPSVGTLRPAAPQPQPQPQSAGNWQQAPQPSLRRSSAQRSWSRDKFLAYGMICGIMTLATLLLPWMIGKGPTGKTQVIMFWDILSQPRSGSVMVTFVMVWLAAVGAIVLSCVLRGTMGHMCQGIVGLVGLLIWMISILASPRGAGSIFGRRGGGMGAVAIFHTLFLMATIMTTSLRLRLRGRLTIRILQGICAGLFLVFSVVALIKSIGNFTDVPSSFRSKIMVDFLVTMLAQLTLIAAAILAIVHAAAINIRKDTLSKTALYLIISGVGVFLLFMIIMPAVRMKQMGFMLLMLNTSLMIVPFMFLFCAGTIGFVTGMMEGGSLSPAPRRAPATPGGSEAQGRLEKLAELKKQGLITDEEFEQKRSKILEQL